MIHHKSDRSLTPIPPDEVSTLRLDGPLRHMLGRQVIHLTKSEALSLTRWIGVQIDRPDLETVPGPEVPGADPFAVNVSRPEPEPALVVRPPKAPKRGRKPA